MKLFSGERIFFVLWIAAIILITACKDENLNGPPEPVIKSAQLEYRVPLNADDKSEALTVSFQFHDGDDDLGVDLHDPQISPINYFLQSADGDLIPVGYAVSYHDYYSRVPLLNILPNVNLSATLVTSRTGNLSTHGSLMDATGSYRYDSLRVSNKNILSGIHYTERDIVGQRYYVVKDTLYWQPNPDYYNLAVQFFETDIDNNAHELKLGESFCADFNVCLPSTTGKVFGQTIQAGPFKIIAFSPTDGLIQYSMNTLPARKIFEGKKIKVRVTVRDRAGHVSNTIESNNIQF